ncbi:hypothetical protein ACFW04_013688 [Cataglyphis niger]
MHDGRCKEGNGELDTFNTVFGWVLMGAISPSLQIQSLHSFTITLDSIDAAVGRFWELEEVPEDTSCSEEDRRCKEIFAKTTYLDTSGRFVVSYLFASEPPFFIDSRSSLGYNNFMQDYIDSDHMELVREPFPSDGHIYYLPHHGVYKLDSSPSN